MTKIVQLMAVNPLTGAYHTQVSRDDNNICTFDFCDTLIGVIHIQINVNDNNTCTIDGYDPITGVFKIHFECLIF